MPEQSAAPLKFYQAGAARGTTPSFATFPWWPFNSAFKLATISAATPPSHTAQDGWSLVLQRGRNAALHSLNGNTKLLITPLGPHLQAKAQLQLSTLIPPSQSSPQIAQPTPQYHRSFLLRLQTQLKTPSVTVPFLPSTLVNRSLLPVQSIPQAQGSAHTAPPSRSGRRIKYQTPKGTFVVYRSKKKKNKTRFHTSIQNSRIKNLNLEKSRTPPPRGVPGAILASEECSPPKGGAKVGARGAESRRTRRRAYRQWRAYHNQCLTQGADSQGSHRTLSTKATQTRAKWYRHSLFWQAAITRKKKPQVEEPRTTPPLSYNSKLRIGALNVQGMADTLKLKSILQLMDSHKLGGCHLKRDQKHIVLLIFIRATPCHPVG